MIVSAEVVALVAAAVAVFAAVLAVRATALVARTVLAHREGSPREPLTVRVTEGHTRRDIAADTRDYAFVVALANHSTSDRRFEPPALRVTYRTRANFLGAVDLGSAEPVAVPAGQSVSVTLRFTTGNVIPRHCRVDAYTLLLVDSNGQRVVLDASLTDVLDGDTDGPGAASWGRD